MRRLAVIALLPLVLMAFAPQQGDSGGSSGPTKRRMTASINDIIRSQLYSKGCWTNHSDMAEASRLKATFKLTFGNDGHFRDPPVLIFPETEPTDDASLQAFIGFARLALEKCDALGWTVPPEYFRLPADRAYINVPFTGSWP